MFKIDGLPDGWAVKEVHIDPDQHYQYVGDDGCLYWEAKIKMEKIQPRRIVLDETAEVRKVKRNEYYIDRKGNLAFWSINCESIEKYNIVREVKETDIPLTKEEPELSLSVNECKEAMRKLETFNVTDLSVKICRFLKDK